MCEEKEQQSRGEEEDVHLHRDCQARVRRRDEGGHQLEGYAPPQPPSQQLLPSTIKFQDSLVCRAAELQDVGGYVFRESSMNPSPSNLEIGPTRRTAGGRVREPGRKLG